MPRFGEWMYNYGWGVGDPRMRGWLFVQGCFAWGVVLSWHVQRQCGILHRVTVLWKWDTTGTGQNGWSISVEALTPVEPQEQILGWMIHEDFTEHEAWWPDWNPTTDAPETQYRPPEPGDPLDAYICNTGVNIS